MSLMEASQCHTNQVKDLIQYLYTKESSQKDRWTPPQLDTHKRLGFRSERTNYTGSFASNSWSLEEFTEHDQPSGSVSIPTPILQQSLPGEYCTDDILSASLTPSVSSRSSLPSPDLDDQGHDGWLTDFCSYSSSPPVASQQRMSPAPAPANLLQQSRPNRYIYYSQPNIPSISNIDTHQVVARPDKTKDWDMAFDWYEKNEYSTTTTPNISMTTQAIKHTCDASRLEGKQGSLQAPDHGVCLDETKTGVMDAAYWNKLGMDLQETEQDMEAIEAFRCAVDLDANALDAWLNLAISYTNEHQRGKAYDCLEAWLQHNVKYQHISKMDHKTMTDRNTALIDRFILAARCSPGPITDTTTSLDSSTLGTAPDEIDADVQVILGLLFYFADETQKSTDCFQAALACRPGDYRLWNQLGSVMLSQQSLRTLESYCGNAIDMYWSAICLNPEYTRARYNLAVAHMKLSQYEQAAHHLVTALTLQQKQQRRQRSVKSSSPSSSMWSSLRLVMYMLNFDHLADACNHYDLTPFVPFLDNSCTFTPALAVDL